MSVDQIMCDSTKSIYQLSFECSSNTNVTNFECVKAYSNAIGLIRTFAGAWMLLIGILGVVGNLIILTTVPYAVKLKRHDLHNNFSNSTVFILNLSVIELCHCLFFVVPQGLLYFNDRSIIGDHGCSIVMSICVLTVTSDMLAMALIATSRYLHISYKDKWNQICDKKRNIILLIFLSWFPGILSLPFLTVMKFHGTVVSGWDCRYGACGFIQSYEYGLNHTSARDDEKTVYHELWNIMYFYTLLIPLFSITTMLVSYILIWSKVHKSTKFLVGTDSMIQILNEREAKMTKAISILMFCSFLCWLPLPVLNLVFLKFEKKDDFDDSDDFTSSHYLLYVIIQSVFVSQYALNFFIYISRSDQFRDAFLDGIPLLRRKSTPKIENKIFNGDSRACK